MWNKCRLKLFMNQFSSSSSLISSPSASTSSSSISISIYLNQLFLTIISSIFILIILFDQLIVTTSATTMKIVQFDNKPITAYNNRNLTISCFANIEQYNSSLMADDGNNYGELNFTTNARMVLTFMSKPRNKKPLHQMQSFLHCHDPYRKNCYSEFNLDLSCIEDQMDKQKTAILKQRKNYEVEAACQVDDQNVCSVYWMQKRSHDCFDTVNIFVINAPKLGEKCLYLSENRTVECGINQYCNTDYGICFCQKSFIASNKQCVRLEKDDDLLALIVNDANITSTFVNDLALSPEDFDDDDDDDGGVRLKLSKSTLRAMVIFLLIIAIILCIALIIVIIWSRHYRRLLKNSGHTSSPSSPT